MIHRHTIYAYAALATLALGLTLYALGYITQTPAIGRAGIIAAIAALPAVAVTQQRRCQQISEEQLAEAHAAGYRQGLDHAARGLLTSPTSPTGGTHHHATPGATIYQLYAITPHRKAQ